jgi:hypothetical protein
MQGVLASVRTGRTIGAREVIHPQAASLGSRDVTVERIRNTASLEVTPVVSASAGTGYATTMSAPTEPPERLTPTEVPERLTPDDPPVAPPETPPDPGPPQKT